MVLSFSREFAVPIRMEISQDRLKSLLLTQNTLTCSNYVSLSLLQQSRIVFKPLSSSRQLIWMFQSRHLNNKINSTHEKALRNTYQDNTSTFQELLNKDNSVSIHHRNMQVLGNRNVQTSPWFVSRNSKKSICLQNKFL